MKTRFNTYDIVCITTELQRLIGMRVNQIYDIDNRCYLIRLQQSEEKMVLLLESGNRFHTTQFEWPKNVAPSGFTMKLRKHLKNKRLESLKQLGVDRVLDFQFGTGEAAYHVILELYDRGNIVLTDHELTILNVLRPHVEGDKIRFAVKEKYPQDRAKLWSDPPLGDALKEILEKSKPGDNLKKILNPNLEYGPSVIDHVLQECGLAGNMKLVKDSNGKGFFPERDLETLEKAIRLAESMLQSARSQGSKGYIIQKKEQRPNPEGEGTSFFFTNVEFHPLLYAQHKTQPHVEYESFDRAVDEFFSALEGQKIDMKTLQVEREAFKKLQNVKKDHEKRLTELEKTQQVDREKAELISRNKELVDQAILVIQTALAHQMPWESIKTLVQNAQERGDPIASSIKNLRLDVNHVTMILSDPYNDEEDLKPMLVDIDMSLTAFANARKYYDQKRYAAKKQQKTLESTSKALKSAERKTKQTVKEALAISSISKARKAYWFEKFFWFISSDNYLVIGGRDQQQNELLVKRYMRNTDIYVHADLSGASSIIIRNHSNDTPPPRTLNEAGQAAVAYSVAWEAKVLTSAWWVHAYQVTKSAPTGEYLTTGSFMIRGKKNYLLPQHLMLGFSFMFRLEDSCIERHLNERQPISQSDTVSVVSSVQEVDEEIPVSEDEEKDTEEQSKELPTITEETSCIEIEDDQSVTSKDVDIKEPTNEDQESDEENFPDTHVKVDHGTGEVIIESKARTISEMSEKSDGISDKESTLSFPSLPKKTVKKNTKEQNTQQKKAEEVKVKEGPKRGQKSKLKKIKSKYKDQDDEDRQAYLEAFQPNKESKKTQKKHPLSKSKAGKEKIPQPTPMLLEAESDEEVEQQEVEVDAAAADAEEALLRQLSGSPYAEDELLFAVPVVAPYSTLHHYKYKVKLTPGTGKRGKAAKTAVQVFLRDKTCTSREKDLLKAVKDEDVARNFPGKVKLSAPQLHKHKK